MPQRIKTIRVPSAHIQGVDSWVDVKPMTVEQFNKNTELMRRAQQIPEDMGEDELDVLREQLDREQRELAADCVVGWNWVDDEDKPLPQPAGNPDIFNALTMAEFKFIGEAMNKSMSIEKKDGKKLKKSF
jgi:hypothetical protein